MVDEQSDEPLILSADDQHSGERLDAFLAANIPAYSRVKLRKAINAGGVQVDGKRSKAAYRLRGGEQITVVLPELPPEGVQAEDIPLDVIYEDDSIAVINKPPAMVVHPAKGHWAGTLTAALAWRFQQLSKTGGPTRPGIVHRLDRDTSGVIIVARTDQAHVSLASQFEARTVKKHYVAIVSPPPDHDAGRIEKPIGVHPYHREKMAIRDGHTTSRSANTLYKTVHRYGRFGVVHLSPATGRTHQLRVHMAAIGYPVLCDRLYSGRSQVTIEELQGQRQQVVSSQPPLLSRQALHAHRLEVEHPTTGQRMEFTAPMLPDMQAVLDTLQQHYGS